MTHADFTHPPKGPLVAGTWLVFGCLAFFCLFATATYGTAFSLPEHGLGEAWRNANWHLLVSGESIFTWSVILAGFSVVLAWARIRRVSFRIGLTLSVFLAPAMVAILTADLDKIVTWAFTLIATPPVTFSFLFGRQDGEFYAEGHLFFLALGWWTMLWVALLARELLHWKYASRSLPKFL